MADFGDLDGRPPGDVTLQSYDVGSDRYLRESSPPGPNTRHFLDDFAREVGGGTILELGSGPGWGADYLEQNGLSVTRTDGAEAFVRRLRAVGFDARVLDARRDELGGPFDGVLADAVLHHLTAEEFAGLLLRARSAVRDDGVLGFTVKEGDGSGWTHAKIGLPRHFTYWREPGLREALATAEWRPISIRHVDGSAERWLFVLARPTKPGSERT